MTLPSCGTLVASWVALVLAFVAVLMVGDWIGSTRERMKQAREARLKRLPPNTTRAPLGVIRGGGR